MNKSNSNRNDKKKLLLDIYKALYVHFGPQHWWPAKSPFEVVLGAILTQNTAWSNVEKAISNLKREKMLSPKEIRNIPVTRLARIIRPSGFYNGKSKKLKNFVKFLFVSTNGSIKKMRSYDTGALRERLLSVSGIGPETADSILLYALGKAIFVVDAYTRRIFSRHGMVSEEASYEDVQKLFMDNLNKKTSFFNEYHALIVETGKNYCKKKHPLCGLCPLSAKIR